MPGELAQGTLAAASVVPSASDLRFGGIWRSKEDHNQGRLHEETEGSVQTDHWYGQRFHVIGRPTQGYYVM
jgi:hypothetical protein